MNRRIRFMPALLALVGMTLPVAVTAQVVKEGRSSLDGLVFASPRLDQNDTLETINDVQGILPSAVANGWASFRGANGEWNALVDKRTGQVSIAEGAGIPWIAGTANKLAARPIDLAGMEAIARGFLPRVAGILGVNPKSLVLNKGRSGNPADYLWFLDFDVTDSKGAVIEGARVVFRVNHGNLIQFGTENLPHSQAVAPLAKLGRDEALKAVSAYIGGFTAADSFIDSGSLHLIPVAQVDNRFGDGFEFGKGRGINPVWQVTFHRDGVMGTWRARVDAATGEVLQLADINDYAQATGGVYMSSPTVGAEIVRPLPFTNISSGGFTNSAGIYSFTGAAVTSSLNGQYVRISDTCGAISKASDGVGNLLFGTSAGTDCTIPAGGGGAGNTHSARTQFYQVNRIKEVVRGWLPTNAWINAQLTANVNLNQTCNAYWNGSTLNFFKSGGGCGNTGQIAAISLHEFGHGMDSNDGNGAATEGGTGEAYGDLTAAISTHESCIGPGFLTSNCSGYGNACTSCTGVRDIDYAKHASGLPATVSNFTQPRCSAGSGPCGKEVHCESYVPSEAVWDFANRDLPSPGSGAAWSVLDRLWYLSRSTSTRSFTCTTGTTFTSNGCSAGNWWKTMRAVDDDDGNLANGTPHGGALFAAFNRHGIACTTDAGASTTFAGCTPPATPTVTLTPSSNTAGLSWSNSGAGVVYDVYRNETGCNAGFIKVANNVSTTSFSDTAVADGITYFYQVVAHPSATEACGGTPSTCQSVVPGGAATPDFTISASPISVSVLQGGSGSSTVTTAISNGFNAAIALSASGQPSGVTVSFSPTSIAAPGSGSSTVTFAVGSAVAVGTYPITITGTGGSLTRTTTVNLTVTSTSVPTQLLVNPGFETGTATPWVATAGVIDNTASQPAHGGSWKAWLDGYGTTHTDSIYQQVTIPSSATSATLTFWLHIDTAETTTTTQFDTLRVQIRNSANTVLATLATYSNLNAAAGYSLKTFNLNAYIGQTIRVYFLGAEDSSLQTSFVIDDTALNTL